MYELWIDGEFHRTEELVTDLLRHIQLLVDGEYDTDEDNPFAYSFYNIEIKRT